MRAPVLLSVLVILAGCVGSETPQERGPVQESTDDASEGAVWTNATGRLSGLPVAPASQDFPVEVPRGAVEVQATLLWASSAADLRLELVDPSGEVVERGFPETATQRSAATLDPPASGTWTVRVTARQAVDEPFTVVARVLLIVPGDNVLADEFTVGGTELFQEINVIMEEGASFAWEFEASSPVRWDIHSHEDGRTQYHERGVAAEGGGTFAAEKRQIYSLLFAPPDTGEAAPTPATVSYRMEGAFRVHSHSQ